MVLSKDDSKGIAEPDGERKKENVAVRAHGFLIETAGTVSKFVKAVQVESL